MDELLERRRERMGWLEFRLAYDPEFKQLFEEQLRLDDQHEWDRLSPYATDFPDDNP